MKTIKNSRRAQLSFDLAFAIILVLTLFGVFLSYSSTTQQSIEAGRRLAALNMLADYTIGNLNSMHSSLVLTGGNVSYTMKLPDDFAFNNPAQFDNNTYEINYNISFTKISGGGTNLTVTDTSYSPKILSITKRIYFDIECGAGASAPSNALRGGSLIFTECHEAGGDLSCTSC